MLHTYPQRSPRLRRNGTAPLLHHLPLAHYVLTSLVTFTLFCWCMRRNIVPGEKFYCLFFVRDNIFTKCINLHSTELWGWYELVLIAVRAYRKLRRKCDFESYIFVFFPSPALRSRNVASLRMFPYIMHEAPLYLKYISLNLTLSAKFTL
jgi:hypothetical protein